MRKKAHSDIFYLPELLEQILHFLAIDKLSIPFYLLTDFSTILQDRYYRNILN